MEVKWHRYSWMKNGKGLKLNTLTAGYVFVEEDGGMGKVLEIYDFKKDSEQDVVDKLRTLGFEI